MSSAKWRPCCLGLNVLKQQQSIVVHNKKLQDVINNPILRTYKRFKHEFKYEDYLVCVRNPKYRKTLTKFRTSSHTLEVERGRHTNPITPVEQRNCNVCHVFEDECHFLLCCHIFADVRHDFLRRIQNKYPNFATLDHMEKFTFLCKIKTPKLIHGQQNSFIMLCTNGIIRPIASLMIYDSQWKTGCSTGSCTNQDFLTWYISFVCISSRTYLHFMYINVCRHVGICVGMHAFASAHRYKYAWVCMITHVFKCMLQHVIILPLIAIHVILFCFYLHLCNFI